MINPAELVRRPVRERDLLPIATDEQVIEYFQRQIEDIRREVKSPIRARHFPHRRDLLRISGEEEFSLIGGNFDFGSLKLSPRQRVERGHAQDLLFKTMEAYGFDQEKSKPHFTYDPYDLKDRIWKEDITMHPDGTTREVLLYPSQTVKGLVFERERSFVTNTGETTDVLWNVVDEGPLLNLNPRIIFGRKPQISL